MTGDLVGVLEAAYQPTESEEAWLHGLLEATLPFAPTPNGVCGFFFDVGIKETPLRFWGQRGIGLEAETLAKMIVAENHAAPLTLLRQVYFEGPRVASGSEENGGAEVWRSDPRVQVFPPLGVLDFVAVRSIDVTGVGITFGWMLDVVRGATPRERHAWGRISSHVTTALRLRRLRRELTDAPAAVLTSSGRCEHAEGAAVGARDSLRDAIGYELGLATSTVASHLSSAARRLGADKRTSLIAMYRASGRATGVPP